MLQLVLEITLSAFEPLPISKYKDIARLMYMYCKHRLTFIVLIVEVTGHCSYYFFLLISCFNLLSF